MYNRPLPGAAVLGLDSLLRAELPCRRGVPLPLDVGDSRRIHEPEQQQRPLLSRAAEQREPQLYDRGHATAHRQRGAPLLRERRGVRGMPLRLGDIRAVAQLQPPPRLPSLNGLQDTGRVFAADIQQRGVRPAAVAVRQPRLRGGVRADQDVHHQDELREGMGRRVPQTGRDQHTVLDRGASARAASVAGQGAHPDGGAAQRHQLGLLTIFSCKLIILWSIHLMGWLRAPVRVWEAFGMAERSTGRLNVQEN